MTGSTQKQFDPERIAERRKSSLLILVPEPAFCANADNELPESVWFFQRFYFYSVSAGMEVYQGEGISKRDLV